MPDITMCKGGNCPIKETCYCFTATPSEWRQSYFIDVPLKEDGTCEYFMKIWDKPKELMRIKNEQVYIDGELVPEELLLSVCRELLNSQYPWNKEKKHDNGK